MGARGKKQPKETKAESAIAPIIAYKGFDLDLTCRGFQYEIGKNYKHSGSITICESGFHACDMPLDVWSYYKPTTSRYCQVELAGKTVNNDGRDSKIASAEITIKAEVKLPEIIRSAVEWIITRAKGNTATGEYGHAAATGNYGHAAATGYSGHAAVKGKNAIAASLGIQATARAEIGGAIMLSAFDDNGNLVAVFASKVGENGIEPGISYRLNVNGKPEKAE